MQCGEKTYSYEDMKAEAGVYQHGGIARYYSNGIGTILLIDDGCVINTSMPHLYTTTRFTRTGESLSDLLVDAKGAEKRAEPEPAPEPEEELLTWDELRRVKGVYEVVRPGSAWDKGRFYCTGTGQRIYVRDEDDLPESVDRPGNDVFLKEFLYRRTNLRYVASLVDESLADACSPCGEKCDTDSCPTEPPEKPEKQYTFQEMQDNAGAYHRVDGDGSTVYYSDGLFTVILAPGSGDSFVGVQGAMRDFAFRDSKFVRISDTFRITY